MLTSPETVTDVVALIQVVGDGLVTTLPIVGHTEQPPGPVRLKFAVEEQLVELTVTTTE